jgi:hypothetical protein
LSGLFYAVFLFLSGKISIEFLHIRALILFLYVFITPVIGRYVIIILHENGLDERLCLILQAL